jgi:hypothetical protein
MITITINAVNRTNDIEQGSFSYSQTLSKAPKKIKFRIKGDKPIPSVGQTVVVQKNASNIFNGVITARSESLLGLGVLMYEFECQNGYFTMDGKLVIKAYSDTTLGAIATDIVTNFMSGFTISLPATTPTVKTARFNYEQPTQCLRKLTEAVGWDWYVDDSNVVHIVPPEDMAAPFEINETNGHHLKRSLKFDRNIIELRNIVYVRGGEYDDPIAAVDAVDKYEANGVDNTFPLVYRYSQTQVTVNGVAQTVGVDFLDDPADFDCLYNYQEKLVRFPDGTLSAGAIVRVFGNAKVPLIVQAEDGESVALYGEREAVEIDKSIESVTEAETLASARLDQWREGSKEGEFKSYTDGWAVGQTVTINSPTYGVNETYKINRVSATLHDHENLIYTVEFIKSGQTELADLLIDLIGESKKNVVIADNEVLLRLIRVKDELGFTDEIVSVTKTTGPYAFTPVTTKTAGKFDFSVFS